MNDAELLDRYHSLQEDYNKLWASNARMREALRLHQKCHRSNLDSLETCHVCNVTREALAQPEEEQGLNEKGD